MLRLKIARFLPFFIIILYSVIILGNKLFDQRDNTIYIPLNKYTDTLQRISLERYGNIEVETAPSREVIIRNPDFLINFLAPDELFIMDNLRLLFFGIGGIILVITFWNFSYERPFTKQTTLGIKLLTIGFFVFISSQLLRNAWLIDYLKQRTGKEFELDTLNIFYNLEFWLGFIFLRITKIFKKGQKLQQEQDLTV